eukprot:scaffold87977_cov57-Phaeocystis_antarctica.AAC.1
MATISSSEPASTAAVGGRCLRRFAPGCGRPVAGDALLLLPSRSVSRGVPLPSKHAAANFGRSDIRGCRARESKRSSATTGSKNERAAGAICRGGNAASGARI